jgi:2,3-bisphosphoglycerate-independent phosphoglycerate mutase
LKKNFGLIAGVLACLGVIVVGYFWAFAIIGSLYDFRSPLKDSAPKPLQPLGSPASQRAIFILVDGLRKDTAENETVMPNLAVLREKGASATIHSEPPSYSEPAYTTLLTGARPDISDGPAVNLDYESIYRFTQDDLFSAAHRAGLKTAISGYYWFEKLVPQAAVDSSFFTPGEDDAADQAVMTAALPWIKDRNEQLILIHLDQVDYAGHHEGGARDPRWNEAATRVDEMIGQVAKGVDLSKDTVLVLSDHGHIMNGGHGGQDADVLVQPLVLAGKGIIPGTYGDVNQTDIAPTLAVLLGVAIPASSQGQARVEMLELPRETREKLPNYASDQLKGVVEAYSRAILGTVSSISNNLLDSQLARGLVDEIRMQKLAPERTLRSIGAFLLALVPLFFIIRYWRKIFFWYIGGAFLTLFIFNLRYTWMDGRTYSLSSVTGEMDMILYSGLTAAVAFAISWLAVMLAIKSFSSGGNQAASRSILFTLFTIYILAIVALVNFGINGWKVTWTLPDFLIQYLGLMAIIIAIFTAAGGLILTGITAFAGWLVGKR